MDLIVKSTLPGMFARFRQIEQMPDRGEEWAKRSASDFEDQLHQNLINQRKTLSSVTVRLYKLRGAPNGSGIRNHIHSEVHSAGGAVRAIVGISQGRATMIAKVQDRGTTIKVTEKMRGWFGQHGVNLRSSTVFIRIPGRRFWRNAWESVRKNSDRELKQIYKDASN